MFQPNHQINRIPITLEELRRTKKYVITPLNHLEWEANSFGDPEARAWVDAAQSAVDTGEGKQVAYFICKHYSVYRDMQKRLSRIARRYGHNITTEKVSDSPEFKLKVTVQ